MVRQLFFVVIFMTLVYTASAQVPLRQYRVIQNGDTLFTAELPEIVVRASGQAYRNNYLRTERLVLKSIALANYIRDLSREIDASLAQMDRKKHKRQYLRNEKQKLFETFSDIVKDMSEREGQVFNKLVYRQSGTTTYTIIEKFLGPGKAFMWQTISRVGGANLKETYDPYYRDKVIEEVMQKIDAGKLRTPRLPRNVQEFNHPVYE